MVYGIENYGFYARKAYEALAQEPIFFGSTDYWKIGNVFDTMTDYLLMSGDAPDGIARSAYLQYQDKRTKHSACWYDDFGWWGIASVKAFDTRYAAIFGDQISNFHTVARDCWHTMHSGKPPGTYKHLGAPNVWENRDPPEYFTQRDSWAVPRIANGVWQYDMFKDKRNKEDECSPNNANPSDPKYCSLGPFQNTVTNGLYLVLALRMHALDAKATGSGEAAKREMGFLNDWFYIEEPKGGGLDRKNRLLKCFDDDSILVRERVGTYGFCEQQSTCPPVQHFCPDAAWCGDQGLILGGLIDYLALDPPNPKLPDTAVKIARGVARHMTVKKVVQPTTSNWPLGDLQDYASGTGVFMRYLLHAFHNNGDVKAEVRRWIAEAPDNNVIYNSAEDACAKAASSGGDVNKEAELFKYFNVLATLTTAIQVMTTT